MIENDAEMPATQEWREPPAPFRVPTFDGSLWGPDVCRCGSHVDPHRHPEPGALGVSVYDEEPEP